MNFQSIFFVLSIFAQYAFGYSKISTGGKLSPEENQKRLDTCGREGLPNPPNPSKPPTWFWVSYQTLPNKETIFTSASQISSRHLLTFYSNLMSTDKKWIHNMSTFNVNCSEKVDFNVEVPTEVVKRLKFTTLNCYRRKKCNSPELTPVRAFLPYYCTPYIQKNFLTAYSPMIVEVHEKIPADPVCLDQQNSSIQKGETVESYRLYENKRPDQSKLNVTNFNSQVIATTLIPSTKEFSGPIVKLFADKWTIVGYSSIYGVSENNAHQLFYRMSWFQDAICSWTGICDGETTKATIPVPTIPQIKATVPVTAAKLTTANKPAAIVTRTAPTPMPRPVPNTFTPVETSVPMTTTPLRPATSEAVANTKSPISIAAVQKTFPPTMVHLTTITTTLTTVATVKPATTKPPGPVTTVTSTKTSPPVKATVATATVARTTVTTVPITVKPTTTLPPSGAFTTVTVTSSTIGETTTQVTMDCLEIITISAQVTTPTTLAMTTDPDSMTVPTLLPQNSTDEITPDSSVDPSAPTNQSTHPEDPPLDDPVTYEPPLALGIDFSLGPEHSIDEPPIDYEEYEERKKHMDDDDQDYKGFWMDENGNGGEKGMRIVLLLIFVIHFMRLQ